MSAWIGQGTLGAGSKSDQVGSPEPAELAKRLDRLGQDLEAFKTRVSAHPSQPVWGRDEGPSSGTSLPRIAANIRGRAAEALMPLARRNPEVLVIAVAPLSALLLTGLLLGPVIMGFLGFTLASAALLALLGAGQGADLGSLDRLNEPASSRETLSAAQPHLRAA